MKKVSSETKQIARYRALQREWLAITRRHPEADPDNVWHILVSLQQTPSERVRIGLLRGGAYRLSPN